MVGCLLWKPVAQGKGKCSELQGWVLFLPVAQGRTGTQSRGAYRTLLTGCCGTGGGSWLQSLLNGVVFEAAGFF